MASVEISIPSGDDGSSDLVTIPEKYQEYLDGVTQMNRRDFQFISTLLTRLGLGESGEGREIPFGRGEFFYALGELQAYGDAVRSLETGFSNTEPILSNDPAERERQYEAFKEREQTRPSSFRLNDLAYLFLHVPEVNRLYLQLHAEKMVEAFPDFVTAMQGLSTTDIQNTSEYFAKAERVMTDAMLPVVNRSYNPHELDLMSWAIGYENHSFQPPRTYRPRMVAGVGNGTFTDFLEKVVDETGGKDLRTKLRKEFMHRDGIGFRSMRVPLRTFGNKLGPAINEGGLDAGRALLDESSFGRGVCPATFTMKVNGVSTERPIAFEYASTIVGRMPRNIPRRS